MIKGKTKSGFEFELSEERLNDMEILDLMSEVEEDDNPLAVSKLIVKILGKDQRDRLYDHVRAEAGNVPSEKVLQELETIFKSIPDVKN